MIDKSFLRQMLALLLLALAGGALYVASKEQESSGSSDGRLVQIQDFVQTTAERFGATSADPSIIKESLPSAEPIDGKEIGEKEVEDEHEAVAETSGASINPVGTGGSRVFDQFRIVRTQGRSRRLEQLRETLADPGTDQAIRGNLQEELLRLMALEEKEEQVEGLLVARGYSDAIVVLSENGAEVIVPDHLNREDAGQIGDMVSRVAGVNLDRITIVDAAPMQ